MSAHEGGLSAPLRGREFRLLFIGQVISTIVQRETPPALMGSASASASANAVPTVFQIVAPIDGAAAAAWQSVGFVFAAAGAGLAALGLVVVLLRPPVGIGVPADASSG